MSFTLMFHGNIIDNAEIQTVVIFASIIWTRCDIVKIHSVGIKGMVVNIGGIPRNTNHPHATLLRNKQRWWFLVPLICSAFANCGSRKAAVFLTVWVNIECYTRDILAGKFEKGVRIWLSSGLCKLALVARRLTVPLTPSQILPMGICKEVPLCCNTKILYMRNQICKIFVIFVLGTWSVTRVVNFLRLGKTA